MKIVGMKRTTYDYQFAPKPVDVYEVDVQLDKGGILSIQYNVRLDEAHLVIPYQREIADCPEKAFIKHLVNP